LDPRLLHGPPGGIRTHVAPETLGSIHEGGELGYALSHTQTAAAGHGYANVERRATDALQHVG
jgi:phosphoketolase